eukprot:1161466-Pelagomonas_calceolata.AAC.3
MESFIVQTSAPVLPPLPPPMDASQGQYSKQDRSEFQLHACLKLPLFLGPVARWLYRQGLRAAPPNHRSGHQMCAT